MHYPFALIGNCRINALIGENARMVWHCPLRPDGAPLFAELLDPAGGALEITPESFSRCTQSYLPGTPILCSTFYSGTKAILEVIDFCPRFPQFGRMFRPPMIVRIVRPLRGPVNVRARFRAVHGWSKEAAVRSPGNSHFLIEHEQGALRCTSNLPITGLSSDESRFLIDGPRALLIGGNEAVEEDVQAVADRFLLETRRHWESWVRGLVVPTQFQSEIIRSAITLKLHCYEETGAILASVTTSLPEEPHTERNWDYRFCWLRDAAFILSAFRSLGLTEELEGFLRFLLALEFKEGRLHPVYRIDGTSALPEIKMDHWSGYQGSGPVRVGNQAAEHIQHDVYGEMLLALLPVFSDERLRPLRSESVERRVRELLKAARRVLNQKDAGIWEFRGIARRHAFSRLMNLSGIALARKLGGLPRSALQGAPELRAPHYGMKEFLKNGVLYAEPGKQHLDASLLLASLYFPRQSETLKRTIRTLWKGLRVEKSKTRSPWLYRYRHADDFGTPASAFVICSFWLIEALAKTGDRRAAEELFGKALRGANAFGLFSEHYDPRAGRQLGNFPQAYSHVGLINAAFEIAKPWRELLQSDLASS